MTGNTVYGQTGTNDIGISSAAEPRSADNVVHSNFTASSTGSGAWSSDNRVFNNTSTGI